MPGLHIVLSRDPSEGLAFEAALADLASDPFLTAESLFASGGFRAGFSGHPGYPRTNLTRGDSFAFLEGAVYDRSREEVEASLRNILQLLESGGEVEAPIRAFVEATDGDFVVALYGGPDAELLLFNDRWARLPSYLYRDGSRAVFARTLVSVLHHLPEIRFDRRGIAEFLMTGYTLGAKTLVEGVEKFPPAGFLRASAGQSPLSFSLKTLLPSVFSSSPRVTEEEALGRCERLFMEALEDRVRWCREAGLNITADVTAGRDSRTIYVGMNRLGVAADFYSDDLETDNETEYLPALERVYGKEIVRVPLRKPAPDFDAMAHLTYATDCTVNCWTAFLAEYKTVERRKMVRFPAARFMGFGGEFIRTVSKVPHRYTSISQLVSDDIYFDMFTRAEVCSVLGMDLARFTRDLVEYFDSYPEAELAHKLKRLYGEYYNILVNAGENRQRRHFWTLQPLWAQHLYTYQSAELPGPMCTREFYDRFMERVEPRATEAPFYRRGADAGTATAVLKYHIQARLRKFTYRRPLLRMRRRLKKILGGEWRKVAVPSDLDRKLVELIEAAPWVPSYLDADGVRRLAGRRGNPTQKYQLLTVMLYFSEVHRRFPDKVRGPSENPRP